MVLYLVILRTEVLLNNGPVVFVLGMGFCSKKHQ